MSLKRKDNRFNVKPTNHLDVHRPAGSLSPQYLGLHNSNSVGRNFFSPKNEISNHKLQNRSHFDDHSSHLNVLDRSLSPNRVKLPPVHTKKGKGDTLFMPCKRHGKEPVKFVDVSSGKFEGLCDVCLVSSEFSGKNMRLERLVDIYEKKRNELLKTQKELAELENQISKLYKDIVKSNVMIEPLIKELDEMEKKIVTQVERCFTKLKAKFIKFNPFKDTRDAIREKIEQSVQCLETVEAGTQASFPALQSLYNEKVLHENRVLIDDLKGKIQMNAMTNPLLEKDFNMLVYEYDKFFEKFENLCRQFANVVKVTT